MTAPARRWGWWETSLFDAGDGVLREVALELAREQAPGARAFVAAGAAAAPAEAPPAPAPGAPPASTPGAIDRRTSLLAALAARPALAGALTVAALLGAWALATEAGWVAPLFLPSPRAVLARFATVATAGFMDATLWQHLAASLGRIALALAAALVTAIPVGIAIGTRPLARAALDPLIEFYRPIPPLAYLPLIVIWFGIGEFSKVLLIALAIFAPVAISTAAGVRGVDANRVLAARSMGATPGQVLRLVVLPSALPAIFTGVRVGLGVGWSTLVAAELVAATRGLGFMIQSAAQFLATEVVVLGIVVIAVVAFGFELAMRALQRRLVPWEGRA